MFRLQEAVPTLASTLTPVGVGAAQPVATTAPKPDAAATVKVAAETRPKNTAQVDLSQRLRKIIAKVSALEAEEIINNSELADFGIDSLMGMELAREVKSGFKCSLNQEELMDAMNSPESIECITAVVYPDRLEADDGDTP